MYIYVYIYMCVYIIVYHLPHSPKATAPAGLISSFPILSSKMYLTLRFLNVVLERGVNSYPKQNNN